VAVSGHKTSVTLEDEFWRSLRDIAHSRQTTLSTLLASIDSERCQAKLWRVFSPVPNKYSIEKEFDNAGPYALARFRDLLSYCGAISCNHGSAMNADHLPDDLPIRSLRPRNRMRPLWAPGLMMYGQTGGRSLTSGIVEPRPLTDLTARLITGGFTSCRRNTG
jgi:Ribbon-helix-helix domain